MWYVAGVLLHRELMHTDFPLSLKAKCAFLMRNLHYTCTMYTVKYTLIKEMVHIFKFRNFQLAICNNLQPAMHQLLLSPLLRLALWVCI